MDEYVCFNSLGAFIALLLSVVMILCIGIGIGIVILQDAVLDEVCANTYQSYKDVVICQESKLDYNKLIIKEQ